MPTYEYACDACGNGFEVIQKMADNPVDSCPECGKKVRRVLSGGIGISFKGSGFYVTDSNSTASAKKDIVTKPVSSKVPVSASKPGPTGSSGT